MKILHRILLFLILVGFAFSQEVFSQARRSSSWADNKFSMFIHYGLYSRLGGVWMGKPVEQGYSEQILSFGVHFSDWYEDVANDFRPEKWNPDSICRLAKDAGMRSIVMTAKHHDGFCMYNTSTTDYNVVKASPLHRDPLKELSRACKKNGLNFGIYFSLIDWHFPAAMPISSHNADSITPAHHEYNLRQVRELLTNYGPVSELWFDMGSLTPEQSKELYELVHSLQPECKVSGRLGNGYHDFSVMADNQLPDTPYLYPWQTAASVYPETWGYRSWQKHVPLKQKIDEKIRDLVRVVSRGGNYLLNIGPKGDGSVVPYEREVLEGIGRWMAQFGDAVYSTGHTPFSHTLDWGECTMKGNMLYLFIDPGYIGKEVELPCTGIRHITNYGTMGGRIAFDTRDGATCFKVPESKDKPWILLEAEFDRLVLKKNVSKTLPLSLINGESELAYTCGDYYTGRPILVGEKWITEKMPKVLTYTTSLSGEELFVKVNGELTMIKLLGGRERELKIQPGTVQCGKAYLRPAGGTLGTIPPSLFEIQNFSDGWSLAKEEQGSLPYGPLSACYRIQDIVASKDMDWPVDIAYSNGAFIELDGKMIYSDFRRGGDVRNATLLIPLKKGKNRIVVKYFNRFAKSLFWKFKPRETYKVYEIKLPLNSMHKSINFVEIVENPKDFPKRDINILNIRLR